VGIEQPAVVHPVQVIAREDQIVIGFVPHEMAGRAADRVGRALEPARALRRLLGGDDVHESARKRIHPIGLHDVVVERGRVELREHEDPTQIGVHAVADRDVDQPVLAADRHRRFRSLLSERKQARPLTAAEDDGKDVVHVRP
jgi:hypothetical protein